MWWEALFWAISLALAISLFIVSDDEPFWVRLGEAVLVGFIWLPMLVLFGLMMLVDGMFGLIRAIRRPK